MTVEVYDKNDKLICRLEEEQRLLGSYPIDDGMRIHVNIQIPQHENLCFTEATSNIYKHKIMIANKI